MQGAVQKNAQESIETYLLNSAKWESSLTHSDEILVISPNSQDVRSRPTTMHGVYGYSDSNWLYINKGITLPFAIDFDLYTSGLLLDFLRGLKDPRFSRQNLIPCYKKGLGKIYLIKNSGWSRERAEFEDALHGSSP